jgi:hypothetical protein
MKHLKGLKTYLAKHDAVSVFEEAQAQNQPYILHLHGQQIIQARIVSTATYDLKILTNTNEIREIPKLQVKFLYLVDYKDAVQKRLKFDPKIKAAGIEPIISLSQRHHIKNKSLFPLMMQKEVIFLTLLEGEIVRGLIAGFSRYDITVHLKGGVPVTILRHSVYDLRNKKGRCYLKSFQNAARDWQKTEWFVETSGSA